MKWRVGDWAEVEIWASFVGFYKVTGFVTKLIDDSVKIQITRVNKELPPNQQFDPYRVGKIKEFATSRLTYTTMFDAKITYYELMRDMALIHNRKKEFMQYSELIDALKDDKKSEYTEKG